MTHRTDKSPHDHPTSSDATPSEIDWRGVRVVGLDVMDTLLYDPFREALAAVAGRPLEEVSQLRNREAFYAFELGRIDEEEYGRRFFKEETGLTLDVGALWEELSRGFAFIDGMRELALELAQRVEVVTMSNYSPWYERLRERFSFDEIVHDHFTSYRVGVRKPHGDFYTSVAKARGIATHQLVFVDDRQVNIDGAHSVGAGGLLFESCERLRAALEPLLARPVSEDSSDIDE